MNNKSSLSKIADIVIIVFILIVVRATRHVSWEKWLWLENILQWGYLTSRVHRNESPVIETTFPELSKVDRDLSVAATLSSLRHISLVYLMPS
jgi:hypothetical protein